MLASGTSSKALWADRAVMPLPANSVQLVPPLVLKYQFPSLLLAPVMAMPGVATPWPLPSASVTGVPIKVDSNSAPLVLPGVGAPVSEVVE